MKTIRTTSRIAARHAVRAHSRQSRVIAPLLAALCALAVQPRQAHAQNTTTIRVYANAPKGVVPTTAFGVNTAAWDSLLITPPPITNPPSPTIPELIKQTGATVLRFPGGSTADYYDYATKRITLNTQTKGNVYVGGVDPDVNFDAFMKVAKSSNAVAMITVNYETSADGSPGTPKMAKEWVEYANIVMKYGVKYWEIGNEVYGNGYYDDKNAWEVDKHAIKTPTEYGNNAAEYIRQMKQVDPTIKVGVVLTAPDNWPYGEGTKEGATKEEWNTTVLDRCGALVDFVSVHWYPQKPETVDVGKLLDSTNQIASMMTRLKAQMAGKCNANVQIMVTETNSTSGAPSKHSILPANGLFLADNMLTWLEEGAANVDWWDLHNGPVYDEKASDLDMKPEYGDYGLLSNGGSGQVTKDGKPVYKDGKPIPVPEPTENTPYPTFYAMKMLNNFAHSGDTLLTVAPDTPDANVTVHAARQANGKLSLLLINKDPSNTQTRNLKIAGYTPQGSATQFYYGQNSTDVTQSVKMGLSGDFAVTLPAYSLTVLQMTPAPVSSSPAFTTTASVTPSTLAPGQTATIRVTPTDTGGALTNGVVDLEVFDASGSRVGQQFYTQQNFASGETKNYTWPFAAPSDMGAYTVKAGVFSQNWASLLYWNDNASAFSVFLSDTAQYNFETDAQGWTATGGAIKGVASSATRAYRGSHSLAVNFNGANSDTQQVYVPLPNVAAGKTVTFHVWIPKDSAVYAIQPYTLQGAAGNWHWTGNFQYTSGLTPNAWNTVTLNVPANAATPLAQLGVQFFTGGAWSGTCYIDSVSW